MIVKNFLKVITIIILFAGCRNNPAPKGQINNAYSELDNMEKVKEIYYRFPAPDEMLNFIDERELAFTDDFLHSANKYTSYLDSRSQALNLGVYSADMAYITLFQRQKEALTYFQVIYSLSDQLRLSSAFDIALMKRFEANLKIPDSLKVIADEAMTNIIDYLVSNDKEKVFAIISVGGFIEGLYISFNLAGEYSEDNPVIQRISDQKMVLENLLGYCHEFENDQNVIEAVKLLEPVKAVYDQLIVTSEETNVTKSEDGSLIISGGNKIIMTEVQYNKLQETILTARTSITENLEN
jgi:hypothetical protein